jgi:CO dehydrogenase maturation factor
VGKTVVTALLARALLEQSAGDPSPPSPILLVDADPAGGLVHALGASHAKTVGELRDHLLAEARALGSDREALAEQLDWKLLAALEERGRFALLAMGRSEGPGCYCRVNALLRSGIERLAEGFRLVLLDAEAGVEQVNRQVVRTIDTALIVTDGSLRGLRSAALLADMLARHAPGRPRLGLVANRCALGLGSLPAGLPLWGIIPEDPIVARFDAEGRSLLELPGATPAAEAAHELVRSAGLGST